MKLRLFAALAASSLLLTAALRPASATSDSVGPPRIDDPVSKRNIDSNEMFLPVSVCDQTIRLTVTAAGRRIKADGNARIRSDASNQSFRVETDVFVPKGTAFSVFADGAQVGTMKARAHRAVLDLERELGTLPAGLDPCAIKQVDVKDASGTSILTGSF